MKTLTDRSNRKFESHTVKNDLLCWHKSCVLLMHFFDMSGHVNITYFYDILT